MTLCGSQPEDSHRRTIARIASEGTPWLSGVLRARGVAGWYAAIGSLWLTPSPYARPGPQERLRLSPWIFAFPLRFARGRPLA